MIALAKPWIGAEEREAVLRVLDSGVLVGGPETRALEQEWAAACEAELAVATSSGSTALHLALLAHGIGPGDEVITTPFTFVATVNAILHAGATPVFVDIEEDTFNLDAQRVAAAVTSRTKAIMPVHVFGQPCDLDAMGAFAAAAGLVVIEDAAQAMGARYDGRPIGSRHTTCFSLYATKNVMSGEGGMITSNDGEIAKRCRMLRSQGRESKEEPQMLGFNARMSEVHAALGRASLRRLPEATARRQKNAARLTDSFKGVAGLTPPSTRPGRDHVWHQYTVQIESNRDVVAAQLREAGVGAGVFYRTAAHRFPFVPKRDRAAAELSVAEGVCERVLSLPVHPLLSEPDLEQVATSLIACVRSQATGTVPNARA